MREDLDVGFESGMGDKLNNWSRDYEYMLRCRDCVLREEIFQRSMLLGSLSLHLSISLSLFSRRSWSFRAYLNAGNFFQSPLPPFPAFFSFSSIQHKRRL